jgi:hypothetical protein
MRAMIVSVPPQRAQRAISIPNTRFSRRAQSAVRGEYAVEPGQVHPRRRYQRRQPCHQIQRFQLNVRRKRPANLGAQLSEAGLVLPDELI